MRVQCNVKSREQAGVNITEKEVEAIPNISDHNLSKSIIKDMHVRTKAKGTRAYREELIGLCVLDTSRKTTEPRDTNTLDALKNKNFYRHQVHTRHTEEKHTKINLKKPPNP